MFSRIIKEFFLKKTIKKWLWEYNLEESEGKINTVGVVVDATYFFDKEQLVSEIKAMSKDFKEIKILVYQDKMKGKNIEHELVFSIKDIGFGGKINKKVVQDFVDYPFDLLINYFDEEKIPLLLVSKMSKAKFKVGFSNVDARIHHFMLSMELNKYKEFVSESFKYLKILNKI
jgi:hypothetical protein